MNQEKMLLTLVIIIFIPLISPAGKAADVTSFDILGIRLGMSFDEALSSIKKTFPNSKPRVLPPCDRSIYGGGPPHCGYTEKEIWIENIGIIFAKNPYGRGVVKVSLNIDLGHDLTEQEKHSLVDKIIAKYGKPDVIELMFEGKSQKLDMQYGGTMIWGNVECKKDEYNITHCWGKDKILVVNIITFSKIIITLEDLTIGHKYEAMEKEERRKKIRF